MKNSLLLAALALLTLPMSAQVWPYNPDANNDSWIGTEDLTTFLSVFDSSFVVNIGDETTPSLAMHYAGQKSYIECAGYCMSIGGNVPGMAEFGLFANAYSLDMLPEVGESSSSSTQTTTRSQYAWCGDWSTDLYMPIFVRENSYFFLSDSLMTLGTWGITTTPISGTFSPSLTNDNSCLCVGVVPNQ